MSKKRVLRTFRGVTAWTTKDRRNFAIKVWDIDGFIIWVATKNIFTKKQVEVLQDLMEWLTFYGRESAYKSLPKKD